MPNLLINAKDVSNFGYSKECDLKFRTKTRDQKTPILSQKRKSKQKYFQIHEGNHSTRYKATAKKLWTKQLKEKNLYATEI